ncbi:MAG TPA: hypothetical protein VGI39_00650 [Polyangiaceae bacterium]
MRSANGGRSGSFDLGGLLARSAPIWGIAAACAASPFTPLACSSEPAAHPDAAADAGPPFEAVPARVYVAKVKNVLVGLAPTDAEVQAVEGDPAQLGALVDAWMQLPEYAAKMTRFFALAFQQTQVVANDFADVVHGQPSWNDAVTPLLLQNLQESFARTAFALTSQGHPLSEAMTTKQLMMTTALKEFYAFTDDVEIDDDGATYDHFRQQYLDYPLVAEAAQGPIPIAQTLDPTSPNFMHWYDPDVATADAAMPGCQADPMLLPVQAITLHWLLLGTIDGRTLANGSHCPLFPGTAAAPQLQPADFNDWTMVTLRLPAPGEATTAFFDLPHLRAAQELVLRMPRVGFFSTPAFFANWPTNVSNQMRVTTHQALIVATGTSIDGTDSTVPPSTPGLDAEHAAAPDCLGCHRTLDPTRSILAATWSWNYHGQEDATLSLQPGLFAFRGVTQPVSSLDDFAAAMATHPLVASGWVQKLCYYVNSAPCDPDDPEVARLVTSFQASGLEWAPLVKALVTSPITTNATETQTWAKSGEVVAVARRDHLCAALDARLGFADVCGLRPASGQPLDVTVPEIVDGLPSDAYGRGAVAPILPNDPTLFFRAGLEGICEAVASQVIDPAGSAAPGVVQWSSASPDAAIGDFVTRLMALPPSDPRSAPAQALLSSHFTSALAQPGTTPTDALRSTFVVACLSPSTVTIGL